jgi:thymidylate synthase
MNTIPSLIQETNLSRAWCAALEQIVKSNGHEITPLVVTLADYEESDTARQAVDFFLKRDKKGSIHTVSDTIFPSALYKLYKGNRQSLYDGYLDILPRIKAIDASSNNRGTYFERLIAYDGKSKKINQLDEIITSLKEKKVKRRSKFQAAIFDPSKDLKDDPYQRFPCLQHVTFFRTSNGGLVLNSFYAMQYLYEKGYGNWLGLINLGKFVADELGTELERFNCFIGVEKLNITKTKAKDILKLANASDL